MINLRCTRVTEMLLNSIRILGDLVSEYGVIL